MTVNRLDRAKDVLERLFRHVRADDGVEALVTTSAIGLIVGDLTDDEYGAFRAWWKDSERDWQEAALREDLFGLGAGDRWLKEQRKK